VFNVTTAGANVLSSIDAAIKAVSSQAATLGAAQNRLQYTADAIAATAENLSASNSRIKDVDMASEMTQLTQQQILQQAGTAMLAQANSQPQMVLKLLQ
jgi:flagellin